MKQINIYFEDKEFDSMKKFKDGISWKDFIILMFTHCLESAKKGDFEIYENKPLIKKRDGN